jgi:hypothetical protein
VYSHGPRARPALQVADIFRDHGPDVAQQYPLTPDQRRVLRDVQACRTAALGGHLDLCLHCGFSRPAYNSCRNRHCPTCQSVQQAAWIDARSDKVLPTHHFHVVFTLPSQFRRLLRDNARVIFDLLFRAASRTLLTLGEDRLGGQLGITMVLHTWTRDLRLHPHVHCVVTGGALARGAEPTWTASRPTFLFPIAVMRKLYRGALLASLDHARRVGKLILPEDLLPEHCWEAFVLHLRRTKWVVYSKRPFGGARQVFEYLGRYTHRVAISSSRLKRVGPDEVVFRTKGDQTATLHPHDFIRRFLQHTLPRRFRKIRHYGLLSPSGARHRLELARASLGTMSTPEPPEPTADDILEEARRCPACDVGRLFRFVMPKGADDSWLPVEFLDSS